jgi:alpha-tubulin suppressor-like RCC1 family protein
VNPSSVFATSRTRRAFAGLIALSVTVTLAGVSASTAHAVATPPIVTWIDNPGPVTVSGRSHVFDVRASDPNNVSIDHWCLTVVPNDPANTWTWTHANIASADTNGYSYSDLLPGNGYVLFNPVTACWNKSASPKPGVFGLTDVALQPDTTTWPNGSYTATMTATNAVGDSASSTLTFSTSNSSPSMTWIDIVDPAGTNAVQGSTILSVQADHDPAGTAHLTTWCLRLDGVAESTNIGAARPDNSYADLLFSEQHSTFDGTTGCWSPATDAYELTRGSFAFDTTYWSNGAHTLELSISDTSGRTTTSTLNLTSQHQAPTIHFDSPAPGATEGASVVVDAIVNHDAGGTAIISSWCASVDGTAVTTNTATDLYRYRFLRRNGTFHAATGCWTSSTTSLDAGAFTIDTYRLVNGTHTIRVVATDSAGRRSAADLVIITSNQFPALQVSAGSNHSCAVLYDHEVSCTGLNTSGQLGQLLGNQTVWWTPIPGLRDVSAVAAGSNFTCAVKNPGSSGTAWCWGGNASGQLGDNTVVARPTPSAVRKLSGGYLTGVSQIAAGTNVACAVVSPGVAGQVWCWGYNGQHQLGDGTTTTRRSAVRVKQSINTLLTGALSVSVGNDSVCAVMVTQRVQCWGGNQYGQLGQANVDPHQFPGLVSRIDGRFNKARSVAVGGGFACARLVDDSVWCWGRNDKGQLGDGTTKAHTAPLPTLIDSATRFGRVISIAAGASNVCAVMKPSALVGLVYCWGDNSVGQLGNGTTTARRWATRTQALPADFTPTAVVCGGGQVLAIGRSNAMPNQPVQGWGRNAGGQLGTGSATAPVTAPTTITDLNGI